jgi:dihydrofolate reductase
VDIRSVIRPRLSLELPIATKEQRDATVGLGAVAIGYTTMDKLAEHLRTLISQGPCSQNNRYEPYEGNDTMSKVRVSAFSVSLDGYAAAPGQSLQNPFGVGGGVLPGWMQQTKMFRDMVGSTGGSTGVDHDVATQSMGGVGAWILGRNMFAPGRGEWDMEWKGWWGPNPPYHTQIFVLTHYARESLVMEGDNVFHFVTGGIHEALEHARVAAGDGDIRIGGGAQTIRQYLQAGLIDELRLAVVPVVLGEGESLFAGINLPALGYKVAEKVFGENAMHVTIRKRA